MQRFRYVPAGYCPTCTASHVSARRTLSAMATRCAWPEIRLRPKTNCAACSRMHPAHRDAAYSLAFMLREQGRTDTSARRDRDVVARGAARCGCPRCGRRLPDRMCELRVALSIGRRAAHAVARRRASRGTGRRDRRSRSDISTRRASALRAAVDAGSDASATSWLRLAIAGASRSRSKQTSARFASVIGTDPHTHTTAASARASRSARHSTTSANFSARPWTYCAAANPQRGNVAAGWNRRAWTASSTRACTSESPPARSPYAMISRRSSLSACRALARHSRPPTRAPKRRSRPRRTQLDSAPCMRTCKSRPSRARRAALGDEQRR